MALIHAKEHASDKEQMSTRRTFYSSLKDTNSWPILLCSSTDFTLRIANSCSGTGASHGCWESKDGAKKIELKGYLEERRVVNKVKNDGLVYLFHSFILLINPLNALEIQHPDSSIRSQIFVGGVII